MTIPLKVVACATGIALAVTAGPVAWAKECKSHIPLRNMHAPVNVDTLRDVWVSQNRSRRFLTAQDRAAQAVRFAFRQRGKPYRWGGTGPYGYDCSGLVQRAWRSAGVRIPRVARSQYRRIHKKIRRSRLRAGDLIFFHGFGHVGMYVGDGRFIHSPRPGKTVRLARLNGYYGRTMVGAVRPGRALRWHGRTLHWHDRRHWDQGPERRRSRALPQELVPGAPCPDSAELRAGLDVADGELGYCA
jgi:hypothetical protein